MNLNSLSAGRFVGYAAAALTALPAAMFVATGAFHDSTGVGILNLGGARDFTEPSAGFTAESAYRWMAGYGAAGRRATCGSCWTRWPPRPPV